MLLIVGSIAAALAFAQTRRGFTLVVEPLLRRALGGQLEVQDGLITLRGWVEAGQVSYVDAEAGLTVELTRLRGTLDLISLLPGRPLHIIDAAADAGTLRWRQSAPVSDRPPNEGQGGGGKDLAFGLPVIIEKARCERADFQIYDRRGEGRIGPAALKAGDIVPGRHGWISLDGPIVAEAADGESRYTGTSSWRVDSEVDEDGIVERVNATTEITVQAEGDAAPPLSYTADVQFALHPEWSVQAEVTARQADDSLGSARVNLVPERGDGGWHASIQFEDVTSTYLNPLLASFGTGTLSSGVMRGTADVGRATDGYDVRADLSASGFSLRGEGSGPTPMVDLTVQQSGSWHATKRELRLDQFDVGLSRSGRTMLSIALDRPSTIDFAGNQPAVIASEVAHLKARVEQFNAGELRPWLAFLGIDRTLVPTQGLFAGTVAVELGGAQEPIVVDTKIDGEGVQLDRAVLGREIVPADVTAEFSGAVSHQGPIRVKRLRIELRPPAARAAVSVAGTADWNAPAADLSGKLDILKTGDFLKWLWPDNSGLPTAGPISGTCTFKIAKPATVSIGAVLEARNVAYSNDRGAEERRDLGARVDGAVDLAARLVVLERADFDIRARGVSVGALNARGRVAYGKQAAQTTLLSVTTRKFESAPWLRLAGVPLGERAGVLPLSGDLEVEIAPGDGGIRVKGSQTTRIAALPVDGGAFDATVEGRLVSEGRQWRADLELQAPRPGGVADAVGLDARIDPPGPQQPSRWHIDAEAKIKRLDAARYDSLWSAGEQSSGTGQPPPGGRPAPATGSYPLDGRVRISFESLAYRGMIAQNGTAEASLAPQEIGVRVSSTTALGGSVQGELRRNSSGSVAVDLRAAGLDVANIRQSFWPDSKAETTGRLDATVSLNAAPKPGEDWRDVASGRVNGKLRDGHVAGLGLLDFIAKQTGVPSIGGLVLSGGDADLTVQGGVAKIENLKATGPAIHLDTTGQFTLRGDVSVEVQPYLGPEMFQQISFGGGLLRPLTTVLRTATGLLGLPFVVTVSGSLGDPKYGLGVRAPGLVESAGKEVFGAGKRSLEKGGELLRGLFGSK